MLFSLKISHKLALMVVVAILSFVVSEAFTLMAERDNSARLAEVEQRLYPALELSTINIGRLSLIELQINSAVATGDETQLEATQAYYATIQGNLKDIGRLNPEIRTETNALAEEVERYYNNATEIALSFIEGTADFNRIGEKASANAGRLQSLRKAMVDMREMTRDRFTHSISETLNASEAASTLGLTIMIIATLLLVGLSLVIGRSISRSLGQVIGSLKSMASGEGDLTSRLEYKGKDELREVVDHFNAFVEKLHQSFATISKDVSGLNAVSTELTASSNHNLERIREQSDAISAARQAVEELVKSVEEVAGFAASASDQAQDAAKFARQGYITVGNNIDTIRSLAIDVEETAGLVNRFEEFSKKVSGLLDTIQAVADQTNLLALNAAIEAARAGEHGRGFAVVADEVRGLAMRTRSATGEIHTVISELTQISGSAVQSMKKSVRRAHEGVDATAESGEMLKQILNNVESISSINEQIAAATYEQSTTFNSVTQHITDIHDNAEQVSLNTRELDAISNNIREVSGGLSKVAGQFRV